MIAAWFALFAFWFAGPASASIINVTLCGELAVNYDDVWDTTIPPDGVQDIAVDDDYVRNNANRAARGAYIRVSDNATPTVYTDHLLTDAWPACTATNVAFETTHRYTLKLLAKATLNGNNTIKVWTCDTLGPTCANPNATWVHVGETNWAPVGTTKTLTTGTHAAWNILAAASWALHRRNAGLADKEMIFYTQACPGFPNNSCYNPSNKRLYIDDNDDERKFYVAHEQGHKVARLKASGLEANRPALASPDTCTWPDHGSLTWKDYPGATADEGIASYYSAVAFNVTTGVDCGFYWTNDDFDESGSVELDENTPSCAGDPAQGWPDEDYLANTCGGTLDDRGTTLDWLRAFWDADNLKGFSTATIFDLWVDAQPSSWDGDGGADCDPLCVFASSNEQANLGCVGDPQERMACAAFSAGLSVDWNDVADTNGVR